MILEVLFTDNCTASVVYYCLSTSEVVLILCSILPGIIKCLVMKE